MTEYIVKIDERFTHTLTVEAASKDLAIEAAYKLLTDGMTSDQEAARDYLFEADGYTGQHDVWEL